jgi:hypothetical protein
MDGTRSPRELSVKLGLKTASRAVQQMPSRDCEMPLKEALFLGRFEDAAEVSGGFF